MGYPPWYQFQVSRGEVFLRLEAAPFWLRSILLPLTPSLLTGGLDDGVCSRRNAMGTVLAMSRSHPVLGMSPVLSVMDKDMGFCACAFCPPQFFSVVFLYSYFFIT